MSAALALPSTTFWNANGERLHLLPVEVTVPLLRFHALREDAGRKLAAATAVAGGTLATTLNALIALGDSAVTAIEGSLGIAKSVRPTAEPSAPTPPLQTASGPSSELNTPPRAATN
jgi:hypothetical protein